MYNQRGRGKGKGKGDGEGMSKIGEVREESVKKYMLGTRARGEEGETSDDGNEKEDKRNRG